MCALALCFVFAAAVSFIFTEMLLIQPALSVTGDDRNVTAVINDYPVKNGDRYYVDTKVKTEYSPLAVNCRLSFSKDDYYLYLEDAELGDELSFNGKVYKLGFGDESYESSFLSQCKVIGASPTGFVEVRNAAGKASMPLIKSLRRSIKDRLTSDFEGVYAGMGIAALLGDKTALDGDVYESMRRAGVLHILAVSGLHLSVWVLFLEKIFQSLNLDKRKYCLLLVFFVAFAMLVAGLSPSICRAGVTMILYLLFYAIYREGDSLNSMGMAVTLILLFRPSLAVSVGFLMSVFSSAGIIGFSAPIIGELRKRFTFRSLAGRRIAETAVSVPLVSFGAWFFTLPLTVFAFDGIPTLSVVSNALIYVFESPMITCSGLYTLFQFVPFFGALFKLFAKCSAFCIITVSKFVASVPFSYLDVTAFSKFGFAALFAGTVICACFIKKYKDRRVTAACAGIVSALTVFFIFTLLFDEYARKI